MTRRTAVALGAAFVVVSLTSLGIARAALDVAGFYNIDAAGDFFTRSTVHLRQEGNVVIGDYDPHGSLHGTMKDNMLSATWNDTRGSGWLTFRFNLQGSGFSGEWGYGGKRPSGQLIGRRILAPQ